MEEIKKALLGLVYTDTWDSIYECELVPLTEEQVSLLCSSYYGYPVTKESVDTFLEGERYQERKHNMQAAIELTLIQRVCNTCKKSFSQIPMGSFKVQVCYTCCITQHVVDNNEHVRELVTTLCDVGFMLAQTSSATLKQSNEVY